MARLVEKYFRVPQFVRRTCRPRRQVCVAIPCHRIPLTLEERQSWASLEAKLPSIPKVAVLPEKLKGRPEPLPFSCPAIYYPDRFFVYPHGYNALLLSRRFYERFNDFEFVFIYQLDSLICTDQIGYWCQRDWDYIGAPWSPDFNSSQSTDFVAVGNGGFSLRRVDTALQVLNAPVRQAFACDLGPLPTWWKWRNVRRVILAFSHLQVAAGLMSVENFLRRFYLSNEDLFWGIYAKRFYPEFRVPPPDEALRFAFETNPAASFEKNNRQLPFGCHAWARYDRDFWEKAGLIPREGFAR